MQHVLEHSIGFWNTDVELLHFWGCEGYVLIDSIPGQFVAEKDYSVNNLSLRGIDVIKEEKFQIETIFPKKVSCADIIAFAARDSGSFVFFLKIIHKNTTMLIIAWDNNNAQWFLMIDRRHLPSPSAGRKDGNITLASNIQGNLPPPTFNVTHLTQIFVA